MWFHSHAKGVTRRIYALTDDQTATLARLLKHEVRDSHYREIDSECPLPIFGDKDNSRHVDPETAIPEHNVFRDRWERKQTYTNYLDYQKHRSCVKNSLNYPEKVF